MSSLNRVTLIGNLTRDVETRSMQDGNKVANFTLATNERWTDKSGQKQERAEYHRCVVFDARMVGVLEKYARKGSRILFEGQLQTRKWADRDGTDKYTTEVVAQRYGGKLLLLDGAPKSDAPAQRAPDPQAPLDDDGIPPWL